MSDPVLKTSDGKFPLRHLKNLKYDIYIIMIAFGFATDKEILIEELAFRLRGLNKYSHLSRDEMKEMLVQSTSISFLFSSEIEKFNYVMKNRSYNAMQDL